MRLIEHANFRLASNIQPLTLVHTSIARNNPQHTPEYKSAEMRRNTSSKMRQNTSEHPMPSPLAPPLPPTRKVLVGESFLVGGRQESPEKGAGKRGKDQNFLRGKRGKELLSPFSPFTHQKGKVIVVVESTRMYSWNLFFGKYIL
jgi:hypothetical protein